VSLAGYQGLCLRRRSTWWTILEVLLWPRTLAVAGLMLFLEFSTWGTSWGHFLGTATASGLDVDASPDDRQMLRGSDAQITSTFIAT